LELNKNQCSLTVQKNKSISSNEVIKIQIKNKVASWPVISVTIIKKIVFWQKTKKLTAFLMDFLGKPSHQVINYSNSNKFFQTKEYS